jgi:hypothetical protein
MCRSTFKSLAMIVFSVSAFALPAGARDVLYYTEEATHRIMACELNGTNPHLVLDTGAIPCGLRVDATAGRMYWTEPFVGLIRSAKLNGTDVRTVLTGADYVSDLAIDPAHGRIYVTQYPTGLVRWGSMSGGTLTTLIDTGGGRPYGIEYNGGQIFWADWLWQHCKIQRANADGTGVTTIATNILGPQTLTATEDWVYIGDVTADKIYRAHRDGTSMTAFADAHNPWGMVVGDGKLFWASHNEPLNSEVGGSIQCVSLAGGTVQTLLVDPVRPWGIAIVDSTQIPEPLTVSLFLVGAGVLLRRRTAGRGS